MKRMMTALFILIFSVFAFADPSPARDIHVAKTGSDSNIGDSGNPYETIRYAVAQSMEGDVIRVHAGVYHESWIAPKEGTRLVSNDGLHAANIHSGEYSAIRLTNNNSGIDGFEIYGDWNEGAPGDGLVRLLGASHLWVKNCKIHDAPHDCDVIKIGASDVLIENCIIYSAGLRTDGNHYQEVVDIYGKSDPDGVTVRGCWIYHTPEQGGDYLIYAKGGARNILWENNVFGPARGGGFGNVSTGCGAASPKVFPSCENFIARNNLFVNCAGDGAFGFTSAKNAYVFNNVFYNYTGGRAFIQFYSTQPGGQDRNEDCYVFNNIFMQSNGASVYQDRGRWSAYTYIPENFQSDNNLYFQVNTSYPANDIRVREEANSLFADPGMMAPSTPDLTRDSWRTIVANFLLQPNSPAINAGCDLSSGAPFHVPTDILGTVRPAGAGFDMGIHELDNKNVDLDSDGDVDGEDLAGLISSAELTDDYLQAMAARFGS